MPIHFVPAVTTLLSRRNPFGRGGRRKTSYVFTEHGAIMAASVLSSQRAVEVTVQVVRAFVKLRQLLASNAELAGRLNELESKYDRQFRVVLMRSANS